MPNLILRENCRVLYNIPAIKELIIKFYKSVHTNPYKIKGAANKPFQRFLLGQNQRLPEQQKFLQMLKTNTSISLDWLFLGKGEMETPKESKISASQSIQNLKEKIKSDKDTILQLRKQCSLLEAELDERLNSPLPFLTEITEFDDLEPGDSSRLVRT